MAGLIPRGLAEAPDRRSCGGSSLLKSYACIICSISQRKPWLVPILRAVDRFGLKTWHLRKFNKEVDRFYRRNIIGKGYRSEATETYRKRFKRYRDSLFTFLNEDGIPWENNMAEKAIRQLAVQRKISGSFFKRSAGHYLLLLALSQNLPLSEEVVPEVPSCRRRPT